jgi:hypothetical protein
MKGQVKLVNLLICNDKLTKQAGKGLPFPFVTY